MYFCPFSTFTICHRITINSRVEVTLYIELSGANCFIVKILEHLFFDRAFYSICTSIEKGVTLCFNDCLIKLQNLTE